MGGGGGGTPQEGNLTQRRGEAESAERKIETTMGNERAGDISRRILSPWTSRLDCLSTSAGRKLSINPINLCALCLSAPLRESKTTTREIRRILCPLNLMPLSTSRPPLNSINLCALCLSAPLRESKTTTTRETPGSGAAADASSIWYNVDGSSEQPSTAEQSGWRP